MEIKMKKHKFIYIIFLCVVLCNVISCGKVTKELHSQTSDKTEEKEDISPEVHDEVLTGVFDIPFNRITINDLGALDFGGSKVSNYTVKSLEEWEALTGLSNISPSVNFDEEMLFISCYNATNSSYSIEINSVKFSGTTYVEVFRTRHIGGGHLTAITPRIDIVKLDRYPGIVKFNVVDRVLNHDFVWSYLQDSSHDQIIFPILY